MKVRENQIPQFRSRTLSHGSRPIATTPFRTRTYSNASSGESGGGGCHPSPPLTDFTLPAQSVLTPPSSNMTMDSPAYRAVRQDWAGTFSFVPGLLRILSGNGGDLRSLPIHVAMSALPRATEPIPGYNTDHSGSCSWLQFAHLYRHELRLSITRVNLAHACQLSLVRP